MTCIYVLLSVSLFLLCMPTSSNKYHSHMYYMHPGYTHRFFPSSYVLYAYFIIFITHIVPIGKIKSHCTCQPILRSFGSDLNLLRNTILPRASFIDGMSPLQCTLYPDDFFINSATACSIPTVEPSSGFTRKNNCF